MNIYEQANKAYFDELKSLVFKYPKHYSIILSHKKKYLLEWINSQLPKLDDTFKACNKCHWILNGLVDFPKCMHCGKPIRTKKISPYKGYGKFCSIRCMTHSEYRTNKSRQTCLRKYGVDHYSKTAECKANYANTCTERYGGMPFSKSSSIYGRLFDKLSQREGRKITNPSQVKEIAEKAKRTKLERYGEKCFDIDKQRATCVERYGVDHYSKTDDYKKKYKNTCLNKYGVENVFQLDDTKEKSKRTCLNRYNVEYYQQTEMFAEQCRQTCLEKYGAEYYSQTDECKERMKQTCLRNNGVEYPMQSEEVREKSKQTSLRTYGVEYPMQSEDVREKSRRTCLEKYGTEHPTRTDEVKAKTRKTCLEKYGVDNPSRCREVRLKAQRRYLYEGVRFDSAPELAYYIWLKDAGADFEYQPDTAFRYEYGGKEHAYFPDFRVGGRFVEIKGGQFLGESGEWICPWDRSLDGVYEAKRLCASENGVEVLYPDDYAKYLEYADAKFGDGWAERFRIH